MNPRACFSPVVVMAVMVPLFAGCSAPTDADDDADAQGGATSGSGGTASGSAGHATSGGAGGTPTTGGTSGSTSTGGASGGSAGSGMTSGGAGGVSATGGTGGAVMGTGGAGTGSGGAETGGVAGMPGGGTSGGMSGSAGAGVAGSFVGGGAAGAPMAMPLDCGENGTALEAHGPPANRVNYVIVADGYSEEELQPDGTLDDHLAAAMETRFSETYGQPYLRYRNFVNICVLRLPSSPICGSSVFGCCGNDSSRLANCNTQTVESAIKDNIPASFEVDWRSVVLNGDSWWNSGGTTMMWSGGNPDAGGGALHEGGHGFHSLADEYDACEQGRVSNEATYGVNVSLTDQTSGGKWEGWLGFDQDPGAGMVGFFGCTGGQTWRSTDNSVMNSLFDAKTAFNPVSREKIIMDIWRAVATPYDSVTPEAGPITNPMALSVNVIDPAVISVDWTVDGNAVAMDGGPTYNIGASGLAAGMHTVTARAYDNAGMDLVRQVPGTTFNRQYWGSGAMGHSDKTVTWTVTID